VENDLGARSKRRSGACQDIAGIFHECENPAAPCAIGDDIRKLSRVKVGSMSGDVIDPALAGHVLESVQETLGLVH
jgi:hypothetical protein